ncbi:glycosyltransferase family 1 protein [Schinkia azotoformans]|uniref:Group 1 glycosyl transferase n=1 Tax=Schinkia azotoformans LMG 9581 TaxID=1131731 RepID=K6CVC3_SCHAZ|nr:glycosyltransferase family 1 protein [Schinkia azotoformans]EKN64177.1 group 1 glycosyl transferase [Schinkia azotoformans LMG 9581]MEC1639564.1 glycosyltransferase family 1 protein [Schinkia azotoformans]MEC1944692.1 glycosyltransferase family 1 protein [Schinkia azotoformans]
MKLLVDPEIFFYGRCGMVRYYSMLAQQLREAGIEVTIPLYLSNSDFIDGRFQKLYRSIFNRPRNFIVNRVNRLSKKWYYKCIEENDYDVLMITSPVFEDVFLEYLHSNKPFIMVVHDTMRCVLGPDGLYDPSGANADRLAYLARRATKVICISNKTKADLIKLTPIDSEKLVVIHTGNLLNSSMEAISPKVLPERYLLFVGDRTGRKNFRFFIRAISGWLEKQEKLVMVCTGSSTKWEQDLLKSLHIEDKVLYVEAPDSILVYLYKNAVALVYPSLYEGFGLPVLEAMSLGCPVVTSEMEALMEVGGDAVMYIDPYSESSILKGVQSIVENQETALALKSKGLSMAEQFTIQRMVHSFKQEILACME